MSSKKLITLKTSDGEEFEVDKAIALRSQIIKIMLEDDCVSSTIPLLNVHSKTMTKVIEYWVKHTEEKGVTKDELKDFDKNFFKVHPSILYHLLLAANYLNDKELMDATRQEVVDRFKDKTPEEIRKEFDSNNDFTGEEEEQTYIENAWAFQYFITNLCHNL